MNYENKQKIDIQKDIKEQFQAIDKTGVRDDREIFQAGLKIADKYEKRMDDIKKNLGNDSTLLSSRRDKLNKHLQINIKNLKGYSYFTKNKAVIQNVANLIDDAENEILTMLEELRENKSKHEKISKLGIGKNSEKVEGGYFLTNSDGSFTMTTATNKSRIDQVLGDLIQEDETRLIDYSDCKNSNIKNTMTQSIGATTCYIRYGKDTQGNSTYVLQDIQGKKLTQRALIGDGVKITPPHTIQAKGKMETLGQTKSREENLRNRSETSDNTNLNSIKNDPHRKSIIDKNTLPSKLEEALSSAPNTSTYIDFLEKSEQRLDEIVIMGKKNGWELHTDAVSKLWGKSGDKMEIHFITGDMEKDIRFLNKKEQGVSDDLWKIIDSHESEYKTFLNNRIQSKWQEYDFLAKKDNILEKKDNNSNEAVIENKEEISYGLSLFEKMLDNLRSAEGNSWDDDDREFVAMKQYVSNALYSIKTGKPTQSDIDTIANKLSDMFFEYSRRNSNNQIGKENIEKSFKDILSGDRTKAQNAIRELGESTTIVGNTHSSFLKEDIDDEISLDDEEFNTMYQNIATKLDAENADNKSLLESLYNAGDATTEEESSIKTILRKNNILPAKDTVKEKKIDKICTKIKENIDQSKKSLEANKPTEEQLWQDMKQEKSILMAKSNKSEQDISRLQVLEVLETNTDLRKGILSGQIQQLTSETMAYVGLEDIVRGAVGPMLTKEAGGSSSDLYDDIVGAGGWFEWSDENSAQAGEMIKMIAEEAAFMVISAALVASGVGAGAGVALMASRVTRWGMKINKVNKLVRIMRQSRKFKTLVNNAKKIKLVNNRATRYIAGKSDILVRAANQGLTHTILATTYRGEWDKDFNEHLVYVLQNTAMYSVLGIVGKSAQSGRIAKRFTNSKGEMNMAKAKITSLFFEEAGMNPADLAINYSFSDIAMTKGEVINNIAMGMVFELIPGVKRVVMGKKFWHIDGVKTPISKVQNIVGDLAKKTEGAYGKDAKIEDLKIERDRLNERASKETNPQKKAIIDNAARKLEEKIAQKQEVSAESKKIKAQMEEGSRVKSEYVIDSKNDIATFISQSKEKLEHMGDLEQIYKDRMPKKIKEKIKSNEILNKKEIQIKEEYNFRFITTLKYYTGKKVKFKNGETFILGNIEDYGGNLLGKEALDSSSGKDLFSKLKVFMFYQTLDNPFKFCSHGFDHSIMVDSYLQNIIKDTEVLSKVLKKYPGISNKCATLLLRLTAIYHDFGYPELKGAPKPLHGPYGGLLFLREFASGIEGKNSLVDFLKVQYNLDDKLIQNIVKDMKDSIFYHSADKIDKLYYNKILIGTESEFLLHNNFDSKENSINSIKFLENVKGNKITIYYREGSESGIINAKRFKKFIKNNNLEIEVKIELDNKFKAYDKIGEKANGYLGRKAKLSEYGIEFKPIDLYSNPLSGIIRLADNMDMSIKRLLEAQNNPIFMNMFYNFGMNSNLKNASSSIFKKMEAIVKMKDGKDKSLQIKKLRELMIQGVIMIDYDYKTGRQKGTKTINIDSKTLDEIFKDGNIDLNNYKKTVVNHFSEIYEIDKNILQTIHNVASEKESGSYSFRHFIGLTSIKDVTLADSKGGSGNKVLQVVVNKDLYKNSDIAKQRVEEDGISINLNEYHIWRLYDVSARVSVDKKILNIEVIDEDGNLLQTTNRNSANDEFNLIDIK